jgi:hypothetical protein
MWSRACGQLIIPDALFRGEFSDKAGPITDVAQQLLQFPFLDRTSEVEYSTRDTHHDLQEQSKTTSMRRPAQADPRVPQRAPATLATGARSMAATPAAGTRLQHPIWDTVGRSSD